jgi:hypothetical protein
MAGVGRDRSGDDADPVAVQAAFALGCQVVEPRPLSFFGPGRLTVEVSAVVGAVGGNLVGLQRLQSERDAGAGDRRSPAEFREST